MEVFMSIFLKKRNLIEDKISVEKEAVNNDEEINLGENIDLRILSKYNTKIIEINSIWNFSYYKEKYFQDTEYLDYFNNYIKIEKDSNLYIVRDEKISNILYEKFNIINNENIYQGKRLVACAIHDENIYNIIDFFEEYKFNYLIIDLKKDILEYKNFNDANGYYILNRYMHIYDSEKILSDIKDVITKIELEIPIVKKNKIIEIYNKKEKEYMKIIIPDSYIEYDDYGRCTTKYYEYNSNEYTSISEHSELAINIKFKFKGDSFNVGDNEYKIINITDVNE
jgi:hypothetical protein